MQVKLITITRWFHSGSKNWNDQVKSGWPKTVDPEAVPQTRLENLVSSTWRVSGKFFMTSAKTSGAAKLCLTLPKYCRTFQPSQY